ncbi:hypothetical protein [Metabacillus bambusae]|uniref:Uncharacterized protein n=1 Tax=Metabacillus bambusae TaxID=2795218 RepID=A0ABS3N7T5_9BACI|nr:hypothetical protein [Metabacillus bambusae]MBO1514349.1 hypothetical protein [Metabacillus bambusae]
MSKDIFQLQAKIIQQLILDTRNGDRYFELLYGDLLSANTDLLVTTVYNSNDGELFNSIKKQLNLVEYAERKIIPLDNGGFIGFIQHPMQHILTVHLNRLEGSVIGNEEFNQIIQSTFSAMAALVYEGYSFKEISLPVIGKKGLDPNEYKGSLQTLIHNAVKYLKYTDTTKTIKYYVNVEEDVPFWESAMNTLFPRNHVNQPNTKEMISNTKVKIVSLIDSFPYTDRTVLKNILIEISKELIKDTQTNYNHLLIKADELVNLLLKDLYKLPEVSIPSSISTFRLTNQEVASLQRQKPISDWYFNYLIMIRQLKDRNYFRSSDLSKNMDEIILFLSILHRVLTLYSDFFKQFYQDKTKEKVCGNVKGKYSKE